MHFPHQNCVYSLHSVTIFSSYMVDMCIRMVVYCSEQVKLSDTVCVTDSNLLQGISSHRDKQTAFPQSPVWVAAAPSNPRGNVNVTLYAFTMGAAVMTTTLSAQKKVCMTVLLFTHVIYSLAFDFLISYEKTSLFSARQLLVATPLKM